MAIPNFEAKLSAAQYSCIRDDFRRGGQSGPTSLLDLDSCADGGNVLS